MPKSFRIVSGLALSFALAAPATLASAQAADASPQLVVLLAVDQLRRDRIDEKLPGGLGRIAREGRQYVDALLDHALTETCPGHATMLTGSHPSTAGIPANTFFDPGSGRTTYCVADRSPDAALLGAPPGIEGRSPRNLRVTALGDWLKDEHPASKSFSVSGKDRAAITLGGQSPDAAYWMSGVAPMGFTTSRYYREALPEWVSAFNGKSAPSDGFWKRLPDDWTHLPPEGNAPELRPDDFEGESTKYSRTSGHPLRAPEAVAFAENFYYTPFLDEITLDFARQLVEREDLGRRGVPDLLAVALSATDLIGHLYGPYSHESHDALRRLDAALGEFLEFLEGHVGRGRVLVALTADHGVLPLPEWLARSDDSECPTRGGRVSLRRLALGLTWNLHMRFTWILTRPRSWVQLAGSALRVDREVAARHERQPAQVAAAVESYLEARDEVRQVWTADEIARSEDGIAALYRHSFVPGRSGDLLIQAEPTCLIWPFESGTSHGSPYLYDRAVPIVFWGPGIEPGRIQAAARTIDIAPTLARRIGVTPPADLDGRPLF